MSQNDPSVVGFFVVRIDPLPLGESASPYIGEGDGLTSERGRVRVCVP